MSSASVWNTGGLLARQPHTSQMTTVHFDDVAGRVRVPTRRTDWSTRGPEDADAKWPAWKVTVVVIVFCAAFWGAVAYAAARVFG